MRFEKTMAKAEELVAAEIKKAGIVALAEKIREVKNLEKALRTAKRQLKDLMKKDIV